MKRSIILALLVIFHLSVKAQTPTDNQVEDAKFQIVKATIEFLASDKETFKDAAERQCPDCRSYEKLLQFVRKNKIKKADVLISQWRDEKKIDTTFANRNKSLSKFKADVIHDITNGPKSKRKKFSNYAAYENKLNTIIEAVSVTDPVAEDVPDIVKVQEVPNPAVEQVVTEPAKIMSEKSSESASYFAFLPDLSKDMYYTIFILLLAVILFLLWILRNKNKVIARHSRDLKEQLSKSGSTEWQSKNMSNELKAVSQKLKDAEAEIAILQDNLKAETERNQRLSVTPKVEKPVVKKFEPVATPGIKYARYADQGDGFSVQELLDEEDSETIFEIMPLSPTYASFKISENQNAQRYALSNSPYFLGKTSQYDTFPSGNSLINTDVPGELKLQGNKWLIVKPVQISFS
jgi:hypothetical protein